MANESIESNSGARTGSGLNILAGIWLILAPFVLGYASVTRPVWNDVIVGAIVLILGIAGASAAQQSWSRWLNILAGVWLFFAPFILGYSGLQNALWNDMILGVIVAVLAIWSYAALPRMTTGHSHM